jgi:2',3'-cyclic-nucleotide 2'-phosphodiesterase
MRILFLGDVVAKSGRQIVEERLPSLINETGCDFVIVNGENAAHGKGITVKIYNAIKNAGADVITLGNHAFSKGEIKLHLDECPDMVRPYNLEPKDIGQSYCIRECNGKKIAVVNILGSVFMDCATDEPIYSMNKLLNKIHADMIFVDLHAEATSEKELFLRMFSDKCIAIVGTHTHIQTADEKVYKGCAFITDVGMCGPYDSILGRDTDEIIAHNVYKEPTRFTPSESKAMLCGVIIDIDDSTNRATHIQRIQERPSE